MDQQSEIIALAIVTTVVTNICLYFFRGLGSLALKVYREDFSRTKFRYSESSSEEEYVKDDECSSSSDEFTDDEITTNKHEIEPYMNISELDDIFEDGYKEKIESSVYKILQENLPEKSTQNERRSFEENSKIIEDHIPALTIEDILRAKISACGNSLVERSSDILAKGIRIGAEPSITKGAGVYVTQGELEKNQKAIKEFSPLSEHEEEQIRKFFKKKIIFKRDREASDIVNEYGYHLLCSRLGKIDVMRYDARHILAKTSDTGIIVKLYPNIYAKQSDFCLLSSMNNC
jgi:hypothetical protein